MSVQNAPAPANDRVAATMDAVYGQQCRNVEDFAEGSQKMFDFTEKSIRRSFIRKVYSILMCQILVTAAVSTFFMYCGPLNDWLDQGRNKTFTLFQLFRSGATVASFIVLEKSIIYLSILKLWATLAYAMMLLILLLCKEARRRTPMNYILLLLFTLAVSAMIGIVTTCIQADKVLIAFGVTALVFLALTLFAFQTKWDVTLWGAALFVMLLALTIFGFAAIFLPEYRTMQVLYSGIGVVVFSIYIIYDTQLMMGGDHKYSITPEEYIFAALNLYLDMMNIFLHLLRLMR